MVYVYDITVDLYSHRNVKSTLVLFAEICVWGEKTAWENTDGYNIVLAEWIQIIHKTEKKDNIENWKRWIVLVERNLKCKQNHSIIPEWKRYFKKCLIG